MSRAIRWSSSVVWIAFLAGLVCWRHEPQEVFRGHIAVHRFSPDRGHFVDLVAPGGVTCTYSLPTHSNMTGVLHRNDLTADDHWRQLMFELKQMQLDFSPDSRTLVYNFVLFGGLNNGINVRFLDSQTLKFLGEVPNSQLKFSGDGDWVLVDEGPPCDRNRPSDGAVYRLRPFQFEGVVQAGPILRLDNLSEHGSWAYSLSDYVNTRTGQRHQLDRSISRRPIVTRDETHLLFADNLKQTHWFDLTSGEDRITSVEEHDWIVEVPEQSGHLFLGAKSRTLPDALRRTLGGPSAWLVTAYEQDQIEIIHPVTGYRPRWLPCLGTFVAVSRDGSQLLTVDRDLNHLLWQLDRWTPGPWETSLLALMGLVVIWLSWRRREFDGPKVESVIPCDSGPVGEKNPAGGS